MGSKSQGTASSTDQLPINRSIKPEPVPAHELPHLGTRRSSITLSESIDSSPEDMDEKTPTTVRNRQETPKDASHRFSKRTKKLLLILLSCAAMFSPACQQHLFPLHKGHR
ncbi:hypothetical protein PG993_004980 [Apiospora rasikravindrae]|uniref:Uncharacterized protein n=1 Tax=Apiospora rasikravindrae TaxID=990691 RepID=A0ABR1TEB1_9PEZI